MALRQLGCSRHIKEGKHQSASTDYKIWYLGEQLGADLEFVWVPRIYNVDADKVSRFVHLDDWFVEDEIFP